MQIAHSLDQKLTDKPTLLSIGKFDGFHRGHQLLIQTAIDRARTCGCTSAVMTFHPHPRQVTNPQGNIQLLTSLDERIELIATLDPDWLIIVPFTQEIMRTSAYDFMQLVYQVIPLRELWTGANFALGRNREGNVYRLMEIGDMLGYSVGSVPPMIIEGAPVSSSRVRNLLRDGIVEGIEVLLGRPFSLHGKVVVGEQRGRTIGFPTANIEMEYKDHAVPAKGVYACCTTIDDISYTAVVNIGVRPTFDIGEQTIEAHVLDWSGDLYGQDLRIDFLHRLRGEQRFSGVDDLKAQIERDIRRSRELLYSGCTTKPC